MGFDMFAYGRYTGQQCSSTPAGNLALDAVQETTASSWNIVRPEPVHEVSPGTASFSDAFSSVRSETDVLGSSVDTGSQGRNEPIEASIDQQIRAVALAQSSALQPAAGSGDLEYRSASILGDTTLELLHEALSEDTTVSRGAAADLESLIEDYPYLQESYRLGRLEVNRRMLQDGDAPVLCSAHMLNDGQYVWPASTTLRLVSGLDFGLNELTIGQQVEPASVVELTLPLRIPADSEAVEGVDTTAVRSAWVLEAGGEPFGPLLILEVTWV